MRVLVIGSGGREHAICWSLKRSPQLTELFCAPGNAGIAEIATCLDIGVMDFDGLTKACRDQAIDLVVVGPENPLIGGIVDHLETEGIAAFGPTKAAARLEGSKSWVKELAKAHKIPTAQAEAFSGAIAAKSYLRTVTAPYVIKADGLAAGKGVFIAETLEDADAAVDTLFGGKFGPAGDRVLIEEFLTGTETSFFVITDGKTTVPLPSAQDFKRLGDGGTGPNTGGMGAYSPCPLMTPVMVENTMRQIIEPTLKALRNEGTPFKGVLYAGLMLTETGPKLIEYNVRFGDPECQVVLPRINNDMLCVYDAVVKGKLGREAFSWGQQAALTVVMAAKGYPDNPVKGSEIKGLGKAGEDALIFHAGTRAEGGRILANGGRVLNITACAKTVNEARDKAYTAVSKVDWADAIYRHDIGFEENGRDGDQRKSA